MASSFNASATYKWDHIDLRKEFDEMMEQHGHWIWLRRSNRSKRCVCWNETSSTKNASCTICTDDGFVYYEEKHVAFDRPILAVRPTATAESMANPGFIQINGKVYYMRYQTNPNIKDEIIERDSDGNIFEVWDIESTEAKRDQLGRIEYFRVTCSRASMGHERKSLTYDPGQVQGRD